MSQQPNVLARPNVAAALEAIEAVVRPEIRRHFGPASCIGTVRAGLDVLRHFGVAARPLAVETSIFNAPFASRVRALDRLPFDRDEGERWFAECGAHSIAITGLNQPPERRWAGHVCLLLEEAVLIDASLDQIARPEHGIVPPAIFVAHVSPAFRDGYELLGRTLDGVDYVYRCHPADRGFERGQWHARQITRRIVRDSVKWARRRAARAA